MPAYVYSHPYNNLDYYPAAPEMEITISHSHDRSSSAELVAFVDSGADATMLPLDTLLAVGARYLRTQIMRDIGDHRVPVDLYRIHVRIDPYQLPGIAAIAMREGTAAIIGRDVLNQLEVTLNGPAQELWLS